jgi:hypothetical protein
MYYFDPSMELSHHIAIAVTLNTRGKITTMIVHPGTSLCIVSEVIMEVFCQDIVNIMI